MVSSIESDADRRERVFTATMSILQEKGYYRIGISDVAAKAGVEETWILQQFGSGKEQLVCDALNHLAPAQLTQMHALLMQAPDTASALEAMFEYGAKRMRASGGVEVCPIAVLALESALRSPGLQEFCHNGLHQLSNVFRERLQRDGIPAQKLAGLSILISAVFEGCFVTSRAFDDPKVIDVVGRQLAELLRSYVADLAQTA